MSPPSTNSTTTKELNKHEVNEFKKQYIEFKRTRMINEANEEMCKYQMKSKKI
jgi:hypothetical protein